MSNRETISALLIFLIFWLGFLAMSGTMFSGYHLMDDHAILTASHEMQTQGALRTIFQNVTTDLEIRLRPVYSFTQQLTIWILGPNFVAWSIFRGVLAAATSFFLYAGMRKFETSEITAFLITLLALVGYHSSIWWMLGPAEAMGMLLLSVAFYYLIKYLKEHNLRNGFAMTAFVVASSQCKESFIVVLPMVIMTLISYRLFFDQVPLRQAFVREWVWVVVMAVACMIEVGFVLHSLGTNTIGYAGIDEGFHAGTFVAKVFWALLSEKTVWLLLIFGAAAIALQLRNGTFSILKAASIAFIFFTGIVFQFFLYDKSGFTARYLVPLYPFYAILLCLIIQSLPLDIVDRKKMVGHSIQFTLVIFICLRFVLNALPAASEFKFDGENLQSMFSKILENPSEVRLLVVLDPVENYEAGISIASFLKLQLGQETPNFLITSTERERDPFHKMLQLSFVNRFERQIVNKSQSLLSFSEIILLPNKFSSTTAKELQTEYTNFELNSFGRYCLLEKTSP